MIYVVLKPDGDVELSFEASEADQAVEMVARLRGEFNTVLNSPKQIAVKKTPSKPKPMEVTSLGPELLETWEWMTKEPGPVSSSDIGLGLGITNSAAYYRVRRLVVDGLVEKQGRLFAVRKASEE